ncbi:hypothetical protein [Desulfomarina sp.]
MKTIKSELAAWLNGDEGYKYLKFIAGSLLKEVKNSGPLTTIWPYHLPADNSETKNLKEEIAHDFYLFFMDHFLPQLEQHPDQIYLIETGNFTKLFYLAKNKFLWQLGEKARSKKANPAGYLYRRLRQTLSLDSLFETKSTKNNGFIYRIPTDSQSKTDVTTIFSNEDFTSWPLLPTETEKPDKEIFTARFLKNSARIFWAEATRRADVSFLALNDLCKYILFNHPWLLAPRETKQPVATGSKIDSESELDAANFLKSIKIVAAQLVETWSREQRKIFCLRLQDPPVGLKKIADLIGANDHNRVHRQFSFCKKSLLEFTQNWPGPPLSELPATCGEIFIDKIIEECKKTTKSP